jgi:two-component system NarL family sensor kinase
LSVGRGAISTHPTREVVVATVLTIPSTASAAPDAEVLLGPDVAAVTAEHARLGVRLQVAVRAVLVVFVAATVLTVPPAHGQVLCAAVAVGYTLAALGVAAWARDGGLAVARWAWLALFLDLAVLTWLTLLTGIATPQSWTADVLISGFPLVPVLASATLRPRVCAAVVVPAVLVYLIAGIATQSANDEPWASLLLRTLVMAGIGAACVGLSWIQRSRVSTIGRLVLARTELLAELTDLERRERRALSEQLHDGALQYVLAARQDLDEARDTGAPEAFDRLEEALLESSRLLRSTVAELHPAVLERAGLPAAVRDLAASASARGGFTAELDLDGWPPDRRTPVDGLLYRTARELLANVVKHAGAEHVVVGLALVDGHARLTVTDDGVGVAEPDVARRLGEGHIGLTSHVLRVEAAGGSLTLAPAPRTGTVAVVSLPVSDGTKGASTRL